MGELRKVTVELDEATASLLDRMMVGDRFTGASDAVRCSLAWLADRDREEDDLWQETVRADGLEQLRMLVDSGLASGEPIEATREFFDDIKRRGRARLAGPDRAG